MTAGVSGSISECVCWGGRVRVHVHNTTGMCTYEKYFVSMRKVCIQCFDYWNPVGKQRLEVALLLSWCGKKIPTYWNSVVTPHITMISV